MGTVPHLPLQGPETHFHLLLIFILKCCIPGLRSPTGYVLGQDLDSRKFDLAALLVTTECFLPFSEHDRGVWHRNSDLLDPVPPPRGLSQGGHRWRAGVRASPLQDHSLGGLPGTSQSPRYQPEWSPPWLLWDFKHNRGRGMSSGTARFDAMCWRWASQHCVALLSDLGRGMFCMWELQAGEEVVWLFTVLHLGTCECVDVLINLYSNAQSVPLPLPANSILAFYPENEILQIE